MAGEIIRLGDSTSHDGTVIEGSQTDICMGKPIAYIGHKVHCPKCKGDFPIVEGVMTTTFYGKGVAVAGMKTSCGAVLLASQFTDIVDFGRGAAATEGRLSTSTSQITAAATASAANIAPAPARPENAARHVEGGTGFDLDFKLIDEVTGAVKVDWPYVIELSDGRRIEGRTDQLGRTRKVSGEFSDQATLRVFAPEHAPINPNWDH